jgi:RNase P subunit RPR2
MDEFCNFIKCLFPFIWLAIIFGAAYTSYQDDQNKKTAWKELARANNLTLVPGNRLDGGAYVYGVYRGYHLKLETVNQNKQTYTRITLSLVSRNRNGKQQDCKLPDAPIKESDVTNLLTPTGLPAFLHGQFKPTTNGRTISYEETGIESNIIYLKSIFDLLVNMIEGYPQVLALGGEAVPALQQIAASRHTLKSVATQLLHDIGRETGFRLSSRVKNLFCPNCLTCFGTHEIHLSWWQSITYYGCRICGQSRGFLNGRLVAVLNSQMETEKFKQNGVLRVNWLAQRKLFDFDEVEIVQATDEDVERFAVQVGNDTDPVRKPRYQEMRCVVSSECRLSENTRRILARMFGAVEVGEVGSILAKRLEH